MPLARLLTHPKLQSTKTESDKPKYATLAEADHAVQYNRDHAEKVCRLPHMTLAKGQDAGVLHHRVPHCTPLNTSRSRRDG